MAATRAASTTQSPWILLWRARTRLGLASCCGRQPSGNSLAPRLPQLLQELPDPVDPLIDLLHARREAQADVRVEAAVVAGDDGDVVLLEQRRREADGVGDPRRAGRSAEVGADVGEAVERALGADAGDLGEADQPLPHVAAALLELLAHLLDALRAPGVGQRQGGSGLAEAGDVAGHLALQLVDSVDRRLGA